MKQVILATGKLRISYGVRSLSAARQVRHMHIFRRCPAMKKPVHISGCFHGRPHRVATAGRTQGMGPEAVNGPAGAAVADENSYLFRICSCRSGSDFSYENNIFSYGESATQLQASQALRATPLHRLHVLRESPATKLGLRISNSMAELWLREDGQRDRMNARFPCLRASGASTVSIRRHPLP